MFVEANKFKHMHLLDSSGQTFDRDEWSASVNSLAEEIDNLRKSVNEVCEQLYIKTGGQ